MADFPIGCARWFVFRCELFRCRFVRCEPSAIDDVAVAQLATAVVRGTAFLQRPKSVRPTAKPELVRHSSQHL